jgi:hypothetical protein
MRKRWMPERTRRVADLVLGFYGMYFAGAMFEGYIMSRVSAALVFMLIFSAIGGRLIAMANASRNAEAHAQLASRYDGGEGVGGDESGGEDLIDEELAHAYEARTTG